MHKKIREMAAPGLPGARQARFGRTLAAMAMVALLGGCADALPSMQMPDLIRDPRKLLSPEEQKEAINDLSQKKAAHDAEAARQAESAKQAEKPKN